ncbi:hypothetical protein [Paenibacillus donghaensis]|uniref:Uncharacterized protein n=1 Tax=Paenibacillus donghaensis TaxID=414771 RepID=A0A2Z2KRU7_9BACL|nr:hypothetical protein [Paenibacillus donghaensis]ASA23211.1 hypothetical protein B9T62_21820 [Paenibacillus donghaensis]
MVNTNNNSQVEADELTADDYAIIAAGLAALGEVFAFLALLKSRQVTKETGGQVDVIPAIFVQSRSRKPQTKRKLR